MDIESAAAKIISIAKVNKAMVVTDFNGVKLSATPSDNVKACIERWDADSVRRAQAKKKITELEQEVARLKAEVEQ